MLKDERLERERKSLRTIRGRWRLRGWHFNPLERLDGENEVIDSLYVLADSPVCWPSLERLLPDREPLRTLVVDLEDLYGRAMLPWEQYRTVFEHKDIQREFLRWPYGTFPARLRKDVMSRFWELKTTTRFSVSEVPSVHSLRRVNWPSGEITDRHAVSLAAMVCIVQAIESLEIIVSSWAAASSRYRKGLPFEWMATHPIHIDWLEVILGQVLDDPSERAFFVSQVADAWDERRQAEAWLAHANTLELQEESLEQAIEATKAQTLARVAGARKAQATEAARKPRSGLTPELVAVYWKSNPDKQDTARALDLAELHGVTERTVWNHYKKAREKNLLK